VAVVATEPVVLRCHRRCRCCGCSLACGSSWLMFANQQSHVIFKFVIIKLLLLLNKICLPGSGTYGTIHFEKHPLPDSLMGRQYPRY
jgi:hypothetical protein